MIKTTLLFAISAYVLAFQTFSANLVNAGVIVASQDHVVRNNGPTVEGNLHVKQDTGTAADRYAMIRFDSATDFGANAIAASFSITANSNTSTNWTGTYDFAIWGINDGTAYDEIFQEGAYVPTSGTLFDGSDNGVNESVLTSLGSFTNVTAGTTSTLNNANLLAFIQADTNNVVSLVITRTTEGGNSVFLDRTYGSPPTLTVTTPAVPEPSTAIAMGLLGIVGFAGNHRRRRQLSVA